MNNKKYDKLLRKNDSYRVIRYQNSYKTKSHSVLIVSKFWQNNNIGIDNFYYFKNKRKKLFEHQRFDASSQEYNYKSEVTFFDKITNNPHIFHSLFFKYGIITVVTNKYVYSLITMVLLAAGINSNCKLKDIPESVIKLTVEQYILYIAMSKFSPFEIKIYNNISTTDATHNYVTHELLETFLSKLAYLKLSLLYVCEGNDMLLHEKLNKDKHNLHKYINLYLTEHFNKLNKDVFAINMKLIFNFLKNIKNYNVNLYDEIDLLINKINQNNAFFGNISFLDFLDQQ